MLKKLFIIAVIANTLTFIDQSSTSILLVYVNRDFNFNKNLCSFSIVAYPFAISLFLLIIGQFIDNIGWKNVLLWGSIIYAFGLLLCGTSINGQMFIISRFIQGIGACCLITSTLVLINNEFPKRIRGRVLGACIGIASIGFSLAPVLFSIMVCSLSWRIVFFINAIICLYSIFLINNYTFKFEINYKNKLDILGFILYSGLLISTIIIYFLHMNIYLAIFLIIFFFIILFIQEKSASNPLISFKIFKNLQFAKGGIILFFVQINITFVFFWTLYIQGTYDINPIYVGIVMLPCFLPALFISKVVGTWYDKKGLYIPLKYAAITLAFGTLLILFSIYNNFLMFFIGILFYGISIAIFIPILNTHMISSMNTTLRGKAVAMLQNIRQIGMVFGLITFGNIILDKVGTITQIRFKTAHVLLLIINVGILVAIFINHLKFKSVD